jgi:glycosyltransferase involved in cell wall biosynthesis
MGPASGAAQARVVLDMRPAQSWHSRRRGIGRYCVGLAGALGATHPDLVHSVLVDSEPLPTLPATLAQRAAQEPEWPAGGVLHVQSPFEPDTTTAGIWPRSASRRGVRLVVTVYDLIPDALADVYLTDPGFRRRYAARRELVRAADHVVTLSASAAADAARFWGIDDRRVTVIGAAPDPVFGPATDRQAATSSAQARLQELEGPYILSNGAVEHRKNLERLVEAYAALPGEVRARWQLVLAGRLRPLERNHFEVMCRRLGIEGRLVLTGYVDDELLVVLTQGADLAIMPSLYEGYGLPVAEAQACGTPAVCSNTSSLVELVPREATFDPLDTASIASVMGAALTDARRRALLQRWAASPPPSWRDVADRLATVYEEVAARPVSANRRRPRVALLVGAARARPGGAEAVEASMTGRADVDVFIDPDADWKPPPDPAGPLAAAPQWDPLVGGYDLAVADTGEGESTDCAGRLAARGVVVVGGTGSVVDPATAETFLGRFDRA